MIYNDEKLILKKNNCYYFQILGQLNTTKRKWCYFVVWTPKGNLYFLFHFLFQIKII
jgi:hypothetical protein